MTPLFQDGQRQQLIIDLMRTGFPKVAMGLCKFTARQYHDQVERGHGTRPRRVAADRAVARESRAIVLCPKGANVSSFACGG